MVEFTKEELLEYIDKFKVISFDEGNIEIKAVEVYQVIYTFFIEIQKFMYNEREMDDQK